VAREPTDPPPDAAPDQGAGLVESSTRSAEKFAVRLQGSQASNDGSSQGASGRPPPPDHGHYDIRIARDGTWYYRGTPIARKPLVRLFASVLRRDESGQFWLVTPAEKGRIDVDDAPFLAVELTVTDGRTPKLNFRTNLGEEVTADADHPIRVVVDVDSGEPSPYILVRDNLEALMTRSVFYQLVDLCVPAQVSDTSEVGVWSCGEFFSLGDMQMDSGTQDSSDE